jgi:multiple sugar transport system permease protein
MKYIKKIIGSTLKYSWLFLLVALCIIPFYMVMLNSTHANADIAYKIQVFPGKFFFINYTNLKTFLNIWRYLYNSLVTSLPNTIFAGYVGTMAAYGFAMFRFRGKNVLFAFVLATMMIPYQLSLLGYFQMATRIGLVDSYIPIILPSLANTATVFWMRAYIESVISSSFIEAAKIDGYSALGIFNKIILPLCKTGLFTISIFNFVGAWNDYITPLIFLTTQAKFTVSVGIASLRAMELMDMGVTYVAVALSILPVLLMYIFLNSKITAGITAGSVKG